MSSPLQPDLRPSPPWFWRAVSLGAICLSLLILGAANHARRTPPELLLSGPKHEFEYAKEVERLIGAARKRVWVAMYVMRIDDPDSPSTRLAQALADAAARGVKVQVCLDLGTDRVTGEIEDKHVAPLAWLTAHGIKAICDEPDRTTHIKAVVIDDQRVVIGSQNWTRDALTRNREAAVEIDDATMAGKVEVLMRSVPGWDGDF
jgi:phosphatidylserine/phosphatidylglycerophosphate/cardiolipin synthase-like enzyme